jgi:hypothetical protein
MKGFLAERVLRDVGALPASDATHGGERTAADGVDGAAPVGTEGGAVAGGEPQSTH